MEETLKQIAKLWETTDHNNKESIVESYYWAVFWANEAIEELRKKRRKMNSGEKPSIDWLARELEIDEQIGKEEEYEVLPWTLEEEAASKIANTPPLNLPVSDEELEMARKILESRKLKRGDSDK